MTDDITVFFSDGVPIDKNTIAVSAGFVDAPDAASSRILWKFADEWASDDVPDDFIVSVTYSSILNQFFALGRNGLILFAGGRDLTFNFENICGELDQIWITEAEDRGIMSRIRAIGSLVLACGWGGQIYSLSNRNYTPFEAGLNRLDRTAFLDVDGNDENDVYAVGMDGALYNYNGSEWNRLDLPTNAHIYAVSCVSSEEVYLAGARGTLCVGAKNTWRFIGSDSFQGNFWSVRKLGEKVYVAAAESTSGLLCWSSNNLLPANLGLGHKPTTHRLYAADGRLWSFGEYDILFLEKGKWNSLSCPENE